jgi:hypothetical protein
MIRDDIEIAEYVQFLLDHGIECEAQDCHWCHTFRNIFEIVRTRLFTSSLYPEVAISGISDMPCPSGVADAAATES